MSEMKITGTSSDQLTILVQNWNNRIQSEDPSKDLDEGMFSLLQSFNKLPGVVSFSSCTGHPHQKHFSDFQLMFGYDYRNINVVFRLYELIYDQVVATWPEYKNRFESAYNFQLAFVARGATSRESRTYHEMGLERLFGKFIDDNKGWRKMATFSFKYRNGEVGVEDGKKFLAIFHSSVETLLQEIGSMLDLE